MAAERLLRGPVRDRRRRGRAAHRRSASRSTPAGGAHYEKFVRVAPPVVDRRASRRRCAVEGGTIAEARDRADQHGLDPAAGAARSSRPWSGSRPPTRPSATAVASAADGHQPALGPQRRRRLPQAPRDGADPARGPRRGRSVTPDGADATPSPCRPRSTTPGPRSWTSRRSASCFPGATVTEVTDDGFSGTVKVKLGPIALRLLRHGLVRRARRRGPPRGHRGQGQGQAGQRHGRGHGDDPADRRRRRRPGPTSPTDLAVTGKPAQFGRGVMQDVSDKLLGQFVACIEKQLTDAAAAPEPEVPEAAVPAVVGDTSAAAASTAYVETGSDALAADTSAPRPAAPAPRQRTRAIRRAGSGRPRGGCAARPRLGRHAGAHPALCRLCGRHRHRDRHRLAHRPRRQEPAPPARSNRKSNPSPSEGTDCSFELRRDSATLEPCHASSSSAATARSPWTRRPAAPATATRSPGGPQPRPRGRRRGHRSQARSSTSRTADATQIADLLARPRRRRLVGRSRRRQPRADLRRRPRRRDPLHGRRPQAASALRHGVLLRRRARPRRPRGRLLLRLRRGQDGSRRAPARQRPGLDDPAPEQADDPAGSHRPHRGRAQGMVAGGCPATTSPTSSARSSSTPECERPVGSLPSTTASSPSTATAPA